VRASGSVSLLSGMPVIEVARQEGQRIGFGGLPLPRLSEAMRETSAYYTITTVDGRGRLADGSSLRLLQWGQGFASRSW
jgi:hypothetical protein